MSTQRVASADSHMTEPTDRWRERLDARFRDRAPEVIETHRGGQPLHRFMAEGLPSFPVSAGFSAGRSRKELADFMDPGDGGRIPVAGTRSNASRIRKASQWKSSTRPSVYLYSVSTAPIGNEPKDISPPR